ncbi:hypothetical protein PM082_006206 [Marasmius tenuissimus]|nr:hypothetical protein PM082_006206 [Marasmius tenuissimus]
MSDREDPAVRVFRLRVDVLFVIITDLCMEEPRGLLQYRGPRECWSYLTTARMLCAGEGRNFVYISESKFKLKFVERERI